MAIHTVRRLCTTAIQMWGASARTESQRCGAYLNVFEQSHPNHCMPGVEWYFSTFTNHVSGSCSESVCCFAHLAMLQVQCGRLHGFRRSAKVLRIAVLLRRAIFCRRPAIPQVKEWTSVLKSLLWFVLLLFAGAGVIAVAVVFTDAAFVAVIVVP